MANEIAEKELAGEIYLAANRLNELTARAAQLSTRMRTEVKVQSIERVGSVVHDRIAVTVYKQMEP